MWALSQHSGGTHLLDRQLSEFFTVVEQRSVQLLEATGTQPDVGRPLSTVKRPPGGRDRPFCIRSGCIGRITDDRAVRRITGRKDALVLRIDQLAIDEQLPVRCRAHGGHRRGSGGVLNWHQASRNRDSADPAATRSMARTTITRK
jgi:hypothetical protein